MGEEAGRRPRRTAVPRARPPRGGIPGSVGGQADPLCGSPSSITPPCGLGLYGQLWTRAPTGELIFRLYRVRFTEPGVGKHLKRWG
ncbi:winged helix-turn-helix domain-containing protein [Streptomyces umbrinus]|uniref:winged helix-turn-helix domain-containing protein n=1 Tax=Streptomyces umbrinus TaxID=67370 RepID=UPI0040396BFA